MANNRELSQFASFVSADSGRVGINTDTFPDARDSFIVAPPSGQTDVFFTIKTLSTNGNTRLQFADPDDTNVGDISYTHSNNAMVFKTADSERLRITSAGRTLLGTTTVPTGLVLGNSLTAASSTGAEVVTFRSDTSVAVGDVCGAFVIGNSDTDGAEDHFVGMWGKVASTNGSMDLHFAAGRSSYEGDTPDVTIKSGGDVGINTTSNNDGAHFQHYQSEVRHQSFQSTNGDLAIVTDNNSNPAVYVKGTGTADLVNIFANTTEVFTITSAGLMGLGASSPGSYIGGGDNFVIAASGADNAGMTIATGTSSTGTINFADGTSGDARYRGRIEYAHSNDALDILTAATTRMRIASNGEQQHFGTLATNINIANTASAGNQYEFLYCQHSSTGLANGTNSFRVATDGDVFNTNNSYGSLSDQRLKENIVDATSQWADIKGLQVRKYNFRENTGHETHTQLGLIAQEVESVSPGLVSTSTVREGETVLDADGNQLESIKSINYSVLYMKAVKALQEAQTRIETLESQHTDLLARVTTLEGS